MLLFLHGADTYRSRQKLNEIIARYKKVHQSGLNLQSFDLTEQQFEQFKDALRHQPMFQEKRLYVLLEPFSNSDFGQNFLKEKEFFLNSEDLIVFYQKGDVPKSNKFLAFLKTKAKSQEFNLLSAFTLRAWAEKEIRSYGLRIESMALTKLIEFVGSDLWRLSNELKKLAAYRMPEDGPRAAVTIEDIQLLVRPRIETNIFKTIEALAAKNKKLAISLLREHLAKGDAPLYLLSMLHYQFRNLLLVKDLLLRQTAYAKLVKTSQLHPWVLKKTIILAAKFGLPELKRNYQRLLDTDLDIKTGKVGPELALELLVAEL